jgi:mRNA interferase MazF
MEPILRGEIYNAALYDTVGSEQTGFRPVLILQNDLLNLNSPTAIVAPITSQIKLPFLQAHFILDERCPLHECSMVLTEQIRVIDRQRLGAYIGRLPANDIRDVEQALCYTLGLIS